MRRSPRRGLFVLGTDLRPSSSGLPRAAFRRGRLAGGAWRARARVVCLLSLRKEDSFCHMISRWRMTRSRAHRGTDPMSRVVDATLHAGRDGRHSCSADRTCEFRHAPRRWFPTGATPTPGVPPRASPAPALRFASSVRSERSERSSSRGCPGTCSSRASSFVELSRACGGGDPRASHERRSRLLLVEAGIRRRTPPPVIRP